MPVVYSVEKLSGSTNGKGLKVTGTTSGTSIDLHQAAAGGVDIDLITLWAVNQNASGATRTLVIGWGGKADPDNLITVSLPAKAGLIMIADRVPLLTALVLTAWADVANEVIVYGSVTRVDKS